MRGHTVAAALAAITVASCAAPSRKLTTRIVEDPITLPKRMASGSINVTAIHYEPTDTTTFPDGTPITIQPLSVTWVSLTGRLAFYW